MNKPNAPELIHLFGDKEESFYQMGLKDKDRQDLLLSGLKELIHTPWETTDFLGLEYFKNLSKKIKHSTETMSYLDAMEERSREVQACLLIPELMCSLEHWIPTLPSQIWGCSSYFAKNSQTGSLMHGRILDFPLSEVFEQQERVIYGQYNNSLQALSFSCTGVPYHGITAMNEAGLSIALHQKYSSLFHIEGTPIFEIVDGIVNQCENLEDVIEYCKSSPSLCTWGLYVGEDKEQARVLEIDLLGPEVTFNIHSIESDQVLYFNNTFINQHFDSNSQLPHGISSYNLMRKKSAQIKCQEITKLIQKKKLDDKNFLKIITRPNKIITKSFKNWQMDAITPSSVGCYIMSLKDQKALMACGACAKFHDSDFYQITDLWKKDKKITLKELKNQKENSPELTNRIEAHRRLMKAQRAFDKRDYHHCYHHLQMAIEYFKLAKSCEQHYPEFFIACLDYQNLKDRNSLALLLEQFRSLQKITPPYLLDHCLLMIARIERELELNISVSESEIQHPKLKQVFQLENKTPIAIISPIIKSLMVIRIDICDVIYSHAHRANE